MALNNYQVLRVGLMEKTLSIIGRGKTSKHANYANDVWAFNDNAMTLPRLTAMFEMHPDWMDAPRLDGIPGMDQYRQWIQQPHPFPIYMHEIDPRVPASVIYPREQINTLFNATLFKGEKEVKDFYTSTTPYAIALAILQGYKRIELYGVELTQETEYREHRDSVFFWIGSATGMGVQVYIHEESKLYSPALYWIR